MRLINPNRAGLVLGLLLGGSHLLWSGLVALGWAQTIIDFIFWLHFIKPAYVIGSFNIGVAGLLIGVTFAIGYAMGAAFGVLWNMVHS